MVKADERVTSMHLPDPVLPKTFVVSGYLETSTVWQTFTVQIVPSPLLQQFIPMFGEVLKYLQFYFD